MDISTILRKLCLLLVCSTGLMSINTAQESEQSPDIMIYCQNDLLDAELINRSIEASREGAEIVICGECLIKQTIRLLENRSYRGQSRSGTILKQADGAKLSALLASSGYLDNITSTDRPVSISHMQIDGNRKNNQETETVGLIIRSWLSVVEDLHIKNMGGDGLRLTNCSIQGTGITSTQVNGRIVNNFITDSGGHGICIEDTQNTVTDWILSDNWIASSGKDGIHMQNAAGWNVERNHIYGVPQNAIYANRLYASSISNNYIEGFGEGSTTGNWHGIYASVQGGAASTIANNRIMNFNMEGNTTSNYCYLSLTVNYGTAMVLVSGNLIRSKGIPCGTGLYYDAPEDTKLVVTSFGNMMMDVSQKRYLGKNVTLDQGL